MFLEAHDSEGVRAKVLSSYQDDNQAYLSVSEQDEVWVLREDMFDGWWECKLANGRRGLLPGSFLRYKGCVVFASLISHSDIQEGKDNVEESSDPYTRLGKLLVSDPNHVLLKALGLVVKLSSADKAGRIILDIFLSNSTNVQNQMLQVCVESEFVASSSAEGTLFRRNSLNSVILASFARRIGEDYIKKVTQPILEKMVNGTDTYEVDPSRIPETQSLETNIQNMKKVTNEFLTRLAETVKDMPEQIGYICSLLFDVVSKNMKETSGYNAMGGFLLLRVIVPVLTTNATCTPERRRGLVLLGKVIINVSNEVEFGKKEPYMSPFNEDVHLCSSKLRGFFDDVLKTFPLQSSEQKEEEKPLQLDKGLLKSLHEFIKENAILVPAIENEFKTKRSIYKSKEDETLQQLKDILNQCDQSIGANENEKKEEEQKNADRSAKSKNESDMEHPAIQKMSPAQRESFQRVCGELENAKSRENHLQKMISVTVSPSESKKLRKEVGQLKTLINSLETKKAKKVREAEKK